MTRRSAPDERDPPAAGPTGGGNWAVQQLAGLLAGISQYDDEPSMLTGAAHRIAEAIDAEVCAIVTGGQVAACVGFPAAAVPVADLVAAIGRDGGALEVTGLGSVDLEVVALPTDDPGHVVVARSTSPLTPDDLHLVRSMGQVVALAQQLRRTADRERALREQSEDSARALRRTNEALVEASRTKDSIISVASHELRTPLTSILGFTATLRDHRDRFDDQTQVAYLDIIERHGRRLLRLVDDLLTVGRLESGTTRTRPEDVPVTAAIAELLSTTDLHATVHGAPDTVAHVDRDHLDQLVLNLVINAHKHGAAPVTIEVAQGADTVEVAVIDRGQGVPEAFVPHLFDRFTQAAPGDARKPGGTGLGLAIVAGLAAANDGSARYERRDGTTRFVVTLPRGPLGTPDRGAGRASD